MDRRRVSTGGWLVDLSNTGIASSAAVHPSDNWLISTVDTGVAGVTGADGNLANGHHNPVQSGLDGTTTTSNSCFLSTLKCVLFNSQSLCNKFSILSHMLDNSDLDIVCITETWLKSRIPDSCIVNGSDYSIWRSDRMEKTGGGVCIITRNKSVVATPVLILKTVEQADVCAIDIQCNNSAIRLINVYRPPRSECGAESAELMKSLVKCLVDLCDTNWPVILVGDFNLPSVDWSLPLIAHDDDNCISRFNLFIFQHAFDQLVNEPTRGDSLLDLIFCNDEFVITNLTVDQPFGSSDHNMVKFSILTPSSENQSSTTAIVDSVKYNFAKADWPSIYQFMGSIDWTFVLQNCSSCELMTDSLYSVLHECFENFVPKYSICGLSRRKRKNYPASLKRLMRRKLAVWHKLKNNFSSNLAETYRRLCRQVRDGVLSADARFEESLVKTGNLGKFFRHAGSKFNNKKNVGVLVGSNGQVISDATEKAELLSEHFKSVFVVDDNKCGDEIASDVDGRNKPDALANVRFTPGAVAKVIRKLKTNSAGGPDSVPPIFLKKCCSFLAEPLSHIFDACFKEGFLPTDWRSAFITPVFKGGDATKACNYRPISLTSTICKIMEVIIKDEIIQYLLGKNLISKRQHAFIQKHSTVTNLLESVHDWNVILRSRRDVDVLYVDFSRAFDSVVHSKLLLKLSNIGIDGALLQWIKAFLTARKQCVVVENCFSNWVDVLSGVPQGSVLGPILFLIFVNDVVDISDNSTVCSLFADDLKIYSAVDIVAGCDSLQNALDKLTVWCNKWQMCINISKTLVLHIGKKNPKHEYSINNVVIRTVESARDLGVIVDSLLSFDGHIDSIVKRAYIRIGILFKGFVTRDVHVLKQAYVTFIRPTLEYASVVWSPYKLKHINAIEKIQRHFTRRIPHLRDLSYGERLAIINLETLELRRLKADLTMYYKILHGLTPMSVDEYFVITSHTRSTRASDKFLLSKSDFCSKALENDFFDRNITCWNDLPECVKCALSVKSFKTLLSKTDLSNYLSVKL